MTSILEISGLTKRYSRLTAVDNLNLSVQEGDIFGFVGPNGSGKTTTMRIAATLLQPDNGDVQVAGYSVREAPRQVRSLIGYMPDVFGVYHDLTVWEYLEFFASCYKLPLLERRQLIPELLDLIDLSHRRDDMVDSLSRGMKQRLSLARTLIHDPKVLLLDEPASGLDPRGRIEMRELLVELSRLGKTIFFSTHILSDVAEICNRVGIIEAGRLVAAGPLDELQKTLAPQRRLSITILGEADAAIHILGDIPGITQVNHLPMQTNGDRIRVELLFSGADEELSDLLENLIRNDVRIIQFYEEQRDLESIFLKATQGKVT
jgi:ABC-2 type transport system ATP-binding protein